jgi:hypothetical protein
MQLTRRSAARLTSLAALSGLALAGCNHPATNDITSVTSGGSGSTVATLTTPKGSTLTVSEPEFYAQLQSFVPNASAQSFAPIGQPTGRMVMQQMLQNLMVEGLAQDEGVAPTNAEIETQYNVNKTIQDARSIKPFEQSIADAGLTPQIIKDLQVKPYLSQIKLATKGATVSDADIQTYYNTNKDKEFTKPARVHIKRIVVANQAEAQAISAAIKGGQTFESQVSKSLDKSTPDGEIAQWVPTNPAPPQLAALIKPITETQAGTVTAPIPFRPNPSQPITYWIVKVVEKKDKEVVSQDGAKDLIHAQLLQQKAQADPQAQQTMQQSLRDFESQAKLSINGAQYASLAQELTHPAPPPPAATSPFAQAPLKR